MKIHLISGAFLVACVFFAPLSSVQAQVETNFVAGGGVRIGWSSTLCGGAIAGAIRYNSGSGGSIDYCNGAIWQDVGGSGGASAINDLSDAATDYAQYRMFLGQGAGANVTTATNSTALGWDALADLTTGFFNTATGAEALRAVTTGEQNTAFGRRALFGYNGIGNTAIGAHAMANGHGGIYGNASAGSLNTAVGGDALSSAGEKNSNVAIGSGAGRNVTTGSFNTLLGVDAGHDITTGDRNIVIGNGVDVAVPAGNDQLNIGNLIYGNMSASKYVGINTPTPAYTLHVTGDIAYTGTSTDISDARLKDNVAPLDPALALIMALDPVSFTMKDDPAKQVEYGFIAQDVQKIYPHLVKAADDADKTLSMNYIGLIAPLVKALQEQQARIEELEKRLEER